MVVVLAVALVVTFMPSMAFATGDSSDAIEVNSIEQLRAEIEKARGKDSNVTIKLKNDITGFVRILGKVQRDADGNALNAAGKIAENPKDYAIDTTRVTLDLNGHNITGGEVNSDGEMLTDATIHVGGHAIVTIKGKGNVTNSSDNPCIMNDGRLTVEDGTYKATSYNVVDNFGFATINGGSYTTLDDRYAIYSVADEKATALTINGGTYEAEYLLSSENRSDFDQAVQINDGDFSKTEHIVYTYEDETPSLDTVIIKGGEFSDEEEDELANIDKAVSERPAPTTKDQREKAIAAAKEEISKCYTSSNYDENERKEINRLVKEAEHSLDKVNSMKQINETKNWYLEEIADVAKRSDKEAAKKSIEKKYNALNFTGEDKVDIDNYLNGYDSEYYDGENDEPTSYHSYGRYEVIDGSTNLSDIKSTERDTLRYLENYIRTSDKKAALKKVEAAYQKLNLAAYDEDIRDVIQSESDNLEYRIDCIDSQIVDETDGVYYNGPDKAAFNEGVEKLVARANRFPKTMNALEEARNAAKKAVTDEFKKYESKKDLFNDWQFEEIENYSNTEVFDSLYNLTDIDDEKEAKISGMSEIHSDASYDANEFTEEVNSIPARPSGAYKAKVANLLYKYEHQLDNKTKSMIDDATINKLNDAAKFIDNSLKTKVALSQKKIDAQKELQNAYKLTNYSKAQQATVIKELDNAKKAINAARTSSAVDKALSNAKQALGKIKTNTQPAKEEKPKKEKPAQSVSNVTLTSSVVDAKSLTAAFAKAGESAKNANTITLGAGVKKIAPSAFVKFKQATTLVVTNKKLAKKKAVKKALKGSNIKLVKVKASGKKKAKKKLLKKYKKAFSKKNCGKKVKVILA